ncbi:MAG: TetR/AcrR family transcriptional regulator [Thermomicrobiales bacterium]|nr:TetR/AcrR family transcriptional regulator [Thermomicrobiales bacterium]
MTGAGDDERNAPAGTRRARAERRREQLLEAALAIFSERGYRAASVREITRAAGVTEAVLYHYFANKVDLWTAVLAAYAPFGRVGSILAAATDEPAEATLGRLGRELLRLLHEREQLVLTLVSEAPAEPEVAAVLGRFLDEVAAEVAEFLTTRRVDGEVAADADPVAAARVFQGALLVHFLTSSLGAGPGAAEPDEAAVARLVGMLWRGLAPRPETELV